MPDDTTSFIHPEKLWRQVGLSAGQTVVHFGCGAGFYLIPAAKLVGSSGKAIGIDLLSDLLAEVQSRAEREGVSQTVHTIRANLEVPNGSTLPNQSANWVLLANILHQSDPATLMAEAARIIAPAGAILVIEWDTVATPIGPPPEHRIRQETVSAAAAAAGITRREAFAPSPYHYGIIFETSA